LPSTKINSTAHKHKVFATLTKNAQNYQFFFKMTV